MDFMVELFGVGQLQVVLHVRVVTYTWIGVGGRKGGKKIFQKPNRHIVMLTNDTSTVMDNDNGKRY